MRSEEGDDQEGQPPPVVGVGGADLVSPWPTGREVVHAALADSVSHLVEHLPVARDGGDPEGVHQCRVAARRLRSDLRTFRPLLDATWASALQADLRSFAGAFGAVRDDDVLLDALRRIDADPLLVAVIERERKRHHRALVALIDAETTSALLDRLVSAAKDPLTAPQADDPADELLRPLVRAPWRRLQRAVKALDRTPADAELHHVRLLTKRCRYSVIAVAPAFGAEAKEFAKALGKLQDALGEHNDAWLMSVRLRDTAAHLDSQLAFAAGVAVGRMRARADAHGDDWRRAWNGAKAEKRRRWL